MAPAGYLEVIEYGGGGGIYQGKTHLQILEVPVVIVATGSVEAYVDVVHRGGKDQRAGILGTVGGRGALELLLIEMSVVVVELLPVPAVVGVLRSPVRIVPAVGEELRMRVAHHAAFGRVAEDEAGLVERGGGCVDCAVGVVSVVGGGVVGQNLDILVAVVLLLLGEIDGGVHLHADAVQVGAQGAVVVIERSGANGVNCLFVAAVAHFDPRACRAAVSHVQVVRGA